MSVVHCAVTNCKMTVYNKPPGITFYSCPHASEMRSKWLQALKNKCSILDWSKSKICSRHFENKYFDSQRKLKETAIPTIFNELPTSKMPLSDSPVPNLSTPKAKVDRILSKMTQSEINADIKTCRIRMKEPNIDNYISDNLKCKTETPMEVRLWLEIKKQEHLNARLNSQLSHSKKHIEMLQKTLDHTLASKKDMQQSIESMKYIVKCLQEKHATLEEQIEILTALEAR